MKTCANHPDVKTKARGLCRVCYLADLEKRRETGELETAKWHMLSAVKPNELTAICSQCGPVRIYYREQDGSWCCAMKEAIRQSNRKNPNLPQFSNAESKVMRDFNRCFICKKTKERMALDHDHKTGRFRGVLCHNCNTGLGHFFDDEELLKQAIVYLNSRMND